MKFISYAQNCEDVLLWRALGHVRDGFYIDAGANDPVDHSVTKAFYDAGWSGINIEPLPSLQQAFATQRPRDINLALAAGATDGSLTLFDVPAVNGWASPDPAVAEQHRAEGFAVAEITVPVRTLASICAEHVRGPIHFLKIDVEGFEGEVLRGMEFARWRPWILVIEATLPNSTATNHASWEPLVIAAGYRFAWFDGLNRYYVADEHAALLDAFTVQPNVFDNFITHHLQDAWTAQQNLVAQADQARADYLALETACDRVRVELLTQLSEAADILNDEHERGVALRRELEAVHASAAGVAAWARDLEQTLLATRQSTSWRITRPLRAAGHLAQLAKRRALLRTLVSKLSGNERVRRLILPLLMRMPWLARRVSVTLAGIKRNTPEANSHEAALPEHVRALPRSARHILADLQQARRRNKHD